MIAQLPRGALSQHCHGMVALVDTQRFLRRVIDAVHAVHVVLGRRPVALFIPLAAIVFSLKNCEGYIRAILVKQLESETLSKGAGKAIVFCMSFVAA